MSAGYSLMRISRVSFICWYNYLNDWFWMFRCHEELAGQRWGKRDTNADSIKKCRYFVDGLNGVVVHYHIFKHVSFFKFWRLSSVNVLNTCRLFVTVDFALASINRVFFLSLCFCYVLLNVEKADDFLLQFHVIICTL